ncbi:hypothetical protein L208DRAFT_1064729, partial [Tricholoma matsutake]
LDKHQGEGIASKCPSKKDSMRDLLTVFSQTLKVSFKTKAGPELVTGRWCSLCRHPEQTLRQCFLKGGNSTCHGHIASNHFEEYERLCKAMKVKVNHQCI